MPVNPSHHTATEIRKWAAQRDRWPKDIDQSQQTYLAGYRAARRDVRRILRRKVKS